MPAVTGGNSLGQIYFSGGSGGVRRRKKGLMRQFNLSPKKASDALKALNLLGWRRYRQV